MAKRDLLKTEPAQPKPDKPPQPKTEPVAPPPRRDTRGPKRVQEATAAAEVGGVLAESIAAGRNRRLVLIAKRNPTPDRFPRRPGMATKHPLAQVRSRA